MAKRRKSRARTARRSRRVRARAPTVKSTGLRSMGETDLIAGILLTIMGGVAVTCQNASNLLVYVGSAIVILGIILTGFGIGDYASSK